MSDVIACPSCGSEDLKVIGSVPPGHTFAGRVLEDVIDGGCLYRCVNCALGFRWPQLSSEQLGLLYERAAPDAWQYEAGMRLDWRYTYEWLDKYVEEGAILDVGCNDGAFLSTLDSHRWQRYGIEINSRAAEEAASRGIEIAATDVEELQSTSDKMDAVVAFDLIEHVRDPLRTLSAMRNSVRTGGIVVVGSGNLDAWSWRMMGSRYWYCTLPEHLSFISPRWCRYAADRTEMTLVDMRTYSHAPTTSIRIRTREAAANLLYRFLPGVTSRLRHRGWGGLDVRSRPELASAPPPWLSAKDHIVALFQAK
jgi:2-polyprenyl-3-methyl-5-hydroxy-6-metoxy-1,4-benzoquinol methylase